MPRPCPQPAAAETTLGLTSSRLKPDITCRTLLRVRNPEWAHGRALALTQTLDAKPCCRRSDKDSDEEDADDAAPRKPVPEWARGRALAAQLATQAAVDPDEIFQQRQKTCPLDEVFGHAGARLLGL